MRRRPAPRSRRRLSLAAFLAAFAFLAPALAFETPARQAILVDHATGAVLLEKDTGSPIPPASMSKLMTAFMVFERLAEGSLSLDDTFAVSEKAWRMGGSKMFVSINSRVSVGDLLRGIIVQSGNDACVVVAEGLAGSEEAFAAEMTERGREIGLRESTFKNASGWPEPGHLMSVRDIAALSIRIIDQFPEHYAMFGEKNFTYNDIKQGNRNPLLYKELGADGLKTGHTEAAGYGLAASAVRSGRRLILVLTGLEGVNERAREAERILDWGFREFANYALFEAGEIVTEADVWLGRSATVPLVIDNDLVVTLARKARRNMTALVRFDGPVPAPIAKGSPLGTLLIQTPENQAIEIALSAGEDVPRLSAFGRVGAALNYLLWGAARRALPLPE